jgi:hypothetical protein
VIVKPTDIFIRQERRPIVIDYGLEGVAPTPALFHCWGEGTRGRTVAIVEMEDGTCGKVEVDYVKFLDTEPEGWLHFQKEKQDAGAEPKEG